MSDAPIRRHIAMAIYTLADMHAASRRSSSIPRQYHRITEAERGNHRFSLADAVELKLKLQALDTAVSGAFAAQSSAHDITHTTSINEAVRLEPPRGSVYVAGSEEFFLVVKSVSRPDLIPHVYAEACKAMLQRRPYVNRYHVSDFNKGVDPTFSEIRRLLPDIDRACGTDLAGAVTRLEAQVAPFPFLRLPAELRLHVYSYILPHEPRSLPPPLDRKTTRPRLALLRVNHQMHNEVRKYFYEHVTLSLPSLFHFKNYSLLEDNVSSIRETIASMNPDIFPFFKQLSIYITGSKATTAPHTEPSQPSAILEHMFSTFKGLERLAISFGIPRPSIWTGPKQSFAQEQQLVEEMKTRLFDYIPSSVNVSWSHEDAARFFHSDAVEQRLWRAVQQRGSISTNE